MEAPGSSETTEANANGKPLAALIRQYKKPGEAGFTGYERAKIKRGLCVKCDERISPPSGRFCESHRIWHNEKSKRARLANPNLANYRTKISGHRARVRVMQLLGGLVCKWCGERDYRVLSIDHKFGHEAPMSRRAFRHRTGFTFADVRAIASGKKTLEDFRVLCANCQARNEHVRGNRRVYPEVAKLVLEAGGLLPPMPDG